MAAKVHAIYQGMYLAALLGYYDTYRDRQATAERCPLHRDSAEILRFAAETCLLMSTTNRFISPSHGETVNGNTLSDISEVPVLGWEV